MSGLLLWHVGQVLLPRDRRAGGEDLGDLTGGVGGGKERDPVTDHLFTLQRGCRGQGVVEGVGAALLEQLRGVSAGREE